MVHKIKKSNKTKEIVDFLRDDDIPVSSSDRSKITMLLKTEEHPATKILDYFLEKYGADKIDIHKWHEDTIEEILGN